MLCRCGVIEGDRHEAAGETFKEDIAKGLGLTGEEENVRRCIVAGESLSFLHPGKVDPGVA